MIEEKKLLKRMEEAYKSGGYILINREGSVELIYQDNWYFKLTGDKITAKLKAKLVEHMDFLPVREGAWKVLPDGAQSMEMSVAEEETGAWRPMEQVEMLPTALSYGATLIYQNEKDGVCAAVPNKWLTCVGINCVNVDLQNGICCKEEAGELACGVCATMDVTRSTTNALRLRHILEALRKVRMVGKEQEEELNGQIDALEEA